MKNAADKQISEIHSGIWTQKKTKYINWVLSKYNTNMYYLWNEYKLIFQSVNFLSLKMQFCYYVVRQLLILGCEFTRTHILQGQRSRKLYIF